MRMIKRIFSAAWACALVVLAVSPTMAQRSPAGSDLAAEIDRAVVPYVEAGDFMGVDALQRGGDAPLILPYGLASIELGVPHRATDVFLIGSISKQFTAVAILLLEQESRLSTGARISRYLPDFKPEEAITIEQLLTHTSGVPDVYSLIRFRKSGGRGGSLHDVARDLGNMELTHRPGSAYAYSNGGYSLLALIIEQVSGMSYGDFLVNRIFAPLGMSATSHDRPAPALANRVPGYDPWGHIELTPAVPPSAAYSTGSGSLWSSAEDLLRWNRALHGGLVLADTSYAKLTRDYGHAYGYGVSVFRRFGRDVIGHDGRVTGYASDVAQYLKERLTVVILSNVQSAARDEIRRSVAAIVLGEPVATPGARAFTDRPSDPPADLAGIYSFGPGFRVIVTESDGRLLARANEGSESELVPMADGNWFSRVLYAVVRFGRDEAGRVDSLIWGKGEGAPVGIRMR